MFAVKRLEVLRRDRSGSYIPACTRNVFLKNYTKAQSQQVHFWGADDRSDYLTEVVRCLRSYLNPSPSQAAAVAVGQ